MASKIMVIRHAEKPGEPAPPFGVAVDGSQQDDELTVRGWQRAGALARFFAPANGYCTDARIAVPRTIFATNVSDAGHSLRPQHTVGPLSDLLGATVKIDFALGDEVALVQAAKASGGVVLISWHHEAIPKIGGLILQDETVCPAKWKKDRFDLVWVFDHDGATASWHFVQVPQLLLSGDSADPIAKIPSGP